jgi:hypothetical protein
MTRILALDVATRTGFAIYNTEDTPSSIALGHKHFARDEVWDKAADLRLWIRELRNEYRPDYAVIERPMGISPQYDKKVKADLLTGSLQDQVASGRAMLERLTVAIERGGIGAGDARAIVSEYFGSATTINSNTTAQLNWLVGTAQATLEGAGIPWEIVSATTWRTILPKDIRDAKFQGMPKEKITKEKIRVFTDRLRIIGGNEDARDAAIMAYWCALKSQNFKLFLSKRESQGLLV